MKKNFQTLLSLTFLLAFGLVFTAQAQVIARAEAEANGERTPTVTQDLSDILSSMPEINANWFDTLERTFVDQLKSSMVSEQEQALQDIIFVANVHGEKVTFNRVISPLLNVYIFDKNEAHRTMAVAALHAIGDKYGMQRLRELVTDEPSETVRNVTRRALADYYNPQNK